MRFQEIVTPEIEIPILEGIVETGGYVDVLIHLPRMDSSNHWRNAMTGFQGNGIAQVFVIGEGVFAAVVYHPPRIGAPE